MNDISPHILIVMVPLLFSNILHMIVVKYNLLNSLTIPIWTKRFGKNKTWRGLVFVTTSNTIILVLCDLFFQLNLEHPAFLGAALGMAYILFELPNSLLKRSIGIQSGERPHKHKITFTLLDKMDSAFGVTLTYFLLGYLPYQLAVLLFLINSLTHIVISQLLVMLKIKSAL